MTGLPDTADIRQFLTEAFSDEELSTLCFDFFRDVYDDFAVGLTKGQRVHLLIEHCQRREVIPNLLAAIHRVRPDQYEKRFPQIPQEVPAGFLKPQRDPRQVFIGYAHEDAGFAHRLAGDLRQCGWHVWITPDSIRPGERWAEAIDRALDESGMFIVVLTPLAVRSRWVKNETYVAIELENQGCLHFIPLDVESCDVPKLWNIYQRVSFLGRYEDGLRKLLTEMKYASETVRGERVVLAGQSMETQDKMHVAANHDALFAVTEKPYTQRQFQIPLVWFLSLLARLVSAKHGGIDGSLGSDGC